MKKSHGKDFAVKLHALCCDFSDFIYDNLIILMRHQTLLKKKRTHPQYRPD
ncbi:hypothetical protein [Alloprevotella tannerae]